jgi:predicted nucleic-acid-binding Zn-ribbon protein
MMNNCPECGSIEIVNDLVVFAGEAPSGQRLIYVSLEEPSPEKKPFVWSPKTVVTGFRASICGECGYTRFSRNSSKRYLTHTRRDMSAGRRARL